MLHVLYFCVMQVSVTVDAVPQDIQAKYQHAVSQLGISTQRQYDARADLQLIRKEQAQKLQEIKQLCQ